MSNPIYKRFEWAINKNQNNQLTVLGHIALSSSLIVVVTIGYLTMFVVSSLWEKDWLGTPTKLTLEQIDIVTKEFNAKPAEKARLITQFQEIEVLCEKHALIMAFFYKQYYISLAMMGSAAVVGFLCLFFISKLGWERINNAIINIFIVAVGVVVLYGNITLIFQQRENLKASQEIYFNYLALRNEVLSYWATGEAMTDEVLTPAKFIHYIDRQMKAISFIRIGFDPSSISSFSEQLNQFTNSINSSPTQPVKP